MSNNPGRRRGDGKLYKGQVSSFQRDYNRKLAAFAVNNIIENKMEVLRGEYVVTCVLNDAGCTCGMASREILLGAKVEERMALKKAPPPEASEPHELRGQGAKDDLNRMWAQRGDDEFIVVVQNEVTNSEGVFRMGLKPSKPSDVEVR